MNARMTALALFLALASLPASARTSTCGDRPKDVPVQIQEKLKGDVEGKVQFLTKLGGGGLRVGIESGRTELYELHKDIDRHQIDMMYLWYICQTVMFDGSLSSFDKTKKLTDAYRVLVQSPPPKFLPLASPELMGRTLNGFFYQLERCERMDTSAVYCYLTVTNREADRRLATPARDPGYIIVAGSGQVPMRSIRFGASQRDEALAITDVPIDVVVKFGGVKPGIDTISRLSLSLASGGKSDDHIEWSNVPLSEPRSLSYGPDSNDR